MCRPGEDGNVCYRELDCQDGKSVGNEIFGKDERGFSFVERGLAPDGCGLKM